MYYLVRNRESKILYIWETSRTREGYADLVRRIDESISETEQNIRDYLGHTYGTDITSPQRIEQITSEVVSTSENMDEIVKQLVFELL